MAFTKKPKTINPDEVDPSVYYYDEIYDEMKDEEKQPAKNDASGSSRKEVGSKYIKGLMETASLRKTEKELRKFKRFASDRDEAEKDDNFKDQDVYITSAYKKKLLEMKELEREKRRRLEAEKDRTMNFAKVSTPISGDDDKNKRKELDRHGKDRITTETDPVSERVDVPVDSRQTSSPQERRVQVKKPRSFEERREYLRELLAKRTVGEAYDHAVDRYMSRKALKQT